jgi:radical SAM superfamily enzyme YgiQ (UPF0313 family)
MVADIILTTVNAKFLHASLGLRYLHANLGELKPRCRIVEFDLTVRPIDMVEQLLALEPRIIGLGVYLWNVAIITEVATILKRVRPKVVLVLGGPELCDLNNLPELASEADYVIAGEGELVFAELCQKALRGERIEPRIRLAPKPEPAQLNLPYALYSDADLAQKVIYVESTRGCPFRCEFCLSANDTPIRSFPLPELVVALRGLLERGCTHFKFVDRSMNIVPDHYQGLLEFFLQCGRSDILVHFEVVPDRLSQAQLELAARFPCPTLQFEAGIQTLNPEVAERIQRRQDLERLERNLVFLRQHTKVHLHSDLIAGLPGESWDSFAQGFDRLLSWRPHEIQVGILKKLRGTELERHDAEWLMVYNPAPPYEILCNRLLEFGQVQRIKRFARYWDLIANHGRFARTLEPLWVGSTSFFERFMHLSDWLFSKLRRNHSIPVSSLAEHLFTYLTEEIKQPPSVIAKALNQDLLSTGFGRTPKMLQPHLDSYPVPSQHSIPRSRQRRQARHQQNPLE